ISAGRLSFRVRKGTGRDPTAKTTDKHNRTTHTQPPHGVGVPCHSRHCITDASIPSSWMFTFVCASHNQPHGSLCGLLHFGQLVPVTFTPHSASRSGLSTPSSLGNLKRNLISKQASRLDAFSGY